MSRRSAFGHLRKRTDTGKWQAIYQDAAGRQHSKQGFATKDEANAWLQAEAVNRRTGQWVDPRDGKVTFAAFARRWEATLVDLRESTQVRDLGYLDRYILPAFGDVELRLIDHLTVRSWVADMRAKHAPATVVKAAQILSKIMRSAVAARMIASSPTDDVPLPKVERHEMRFLTLAQIADLADAIDERYRGVVLLGAYCGLRVGEMFGLRVGRVDLLRRRLEVVEIATDVQGRVVLGPPKTRAGRRTVPMPRLVVSALEPAIVGLNADEPVFQAPRGGHVRLNTWRRRYWLPAVRTAGLGALRIHDLRHTAVALWLHAGATPVEVARRAGHSSTVVVLDRYGHVMPGDDDRLTDTLDRLGSSVTSPIAPVLNLGSR